MLSFIPFSDSSLICIKRINTSVLPKCTALIPIVYVIILKIRLIVFIWYFRETTEDADSQGDASSQPDTISIASRTSQNTVDSDKVELNYKNTNQV